MKAQTLFVTLGLVFASASAFGWNTCGEAGSWKRRLVPDQFGKARFSPACNNHDRCYEKCGKKKDNCDQDFHSDLDDACKKAYPSYLRGPCYTASDTYHSAVHRMGGDAYRAAQKKSRCK